MKLQGENGTIDAIGRHGVYSRYYLHKGKIYKIKGYFFVAIKSE
jgi:hypothetical protein